jgi:uncharacterized membrane protein HdeD (DUF308 family)
MESTFLRRFWWLPVVLGIAALVLSIALFTNPDFNTVLFIKQSGWLLAVFALLFAGFYFFVYRGGAGGQWKPYALALVGLVGGILVASYADILSKTVNWVLGGYALWLGVVQLLSAVRANQRAYFSWITGSASIALGLLMLWNPAFMNLTYLMAAYALLFGAWLVYVGVMQR